MSLERVTVTIPADLWAAGQRFADASGTSFSAVVSAALTTFLRGCLVDDWLALYQAEHGDFGEDELCRIATDAGVPYRPESGDRRSSARGLGG
jgi:hypothetical protein